MYDNTEKSLRFEQRVKRLRRNLHGSLERVLADAAALDQGLVHAKTYATSSESDAVPEST